MKIIAKPYITVIKEPFSVVNEELGLKYDAMRVTPYTGEVEFYYKGSKVAALSTTKLNTWDTLTINGLEGIIKVSIE